MSGFTNPITSGGGALVRDAVESPGYVPDTTGWHLDRDGSADLASANVRGSVLSQQPSRSMGTVNKTLLNGVQYNIPWTVDRWNVGAPAVNLLYGDSLAAPRKGIYAAEVSAQLDGIWNGRVRLCWGPTNVVVAGLAATTDVFSANKLLALALGEVVYATIHQTSGVTRSLVGGPTALTSLTLHYLSDIP